MSTVNMSNRARKPVAAAVAAAVALGGAFALGSTVPVNAAPFAVSQTAVKEAAPDNVIDVRRRHRHRSGAAVAGLALGIIGSALAYQHYRDHRRHYHRHYYHGGYYPHYGYRY